jgi:hypothetical protein
MKTINLIEYLQREEYALTKGNDFLEWVMESVFERDNENIFHPGAAIVDGGIGPYIFTLNMTFTNHPYTQVEVRFECKSGVACVTICIPIMKSADVFCIHVPRASVITCAGRKTIIMDAFPVSDQLRPMQVAEKVIAAGKELLNFLK